MVRMRIRIKFRFLLVIHPTLLFTRTFDMRNKSLDLTKEVKLATSSSTSSAMEIIESRRAFRSLIV